MSDLYEAVTARIVAALEAGTPPWIRPWSTDPADAAPCNLATRRPYRGVNVLLLNLQAAACGYERNRWLTFRGAQALGARVRRGETGTPIVFFKLKEVRGESEVSEAGGDVRVVPLLRTFTVFNAAQIEGLPPELLPQGPSAPAWSPLEAAEDVLWASGAEIQHGGSKAFYAPSQDRIQLPARSAFPEARDYYAVALHELTHWTGHPSRCNRPLMPRQTIEAYAFEELVAEMGAAFLCAHVGIPGRLEHASYIESWLRAMRSDKRLIFTAASRAQAAADYVLGLASPQAAEAAEVAA
ncbi:zincin-like metallopeptidase domain-containing protein [Quisquiliibacterium transsilvanicum]|uniref:Antirestriction protein ArdC n=1 Tax=Quisquiliibacterium transsilvanicum TaxID=1549638 RepID=A0A7W8M933_9BURK|nr:zincin-like metallopeptidase domain-containing protein [Quisquiliibacterium transsilvanicum]MBB5271900.1 antirestriction protein ArdC [Quisquiliibacterium transsilvanicum]